MEWMAHVHIPKCEAGKSKVFSFFTPTSILRAIYHQTRRVGSNVYVNDVNRRLSDRHE